MKNITVKIKDVDYFQARVWAAERGTSVSAAVTWFLSTLPTHKGAARQFSQPDAANDRESPSASPSAPASTTLAGS